MICFPAFSITQLATRIRRHALQMVHAANASHIGGALSIADILAVLYGDVMRISPQKPLDEDRDRLIVSKGHAAAAVYASLAECGFFPLDWLKEYARSGQPLAGHLTATGVPGVEVSTGALGHGLSIGCGMAMAAQARQAPWRVFVLMSDGECNEGAIWEAAMLAAQRKLDNLIAIVDANGLQGLGYTNEIIDMEPISDKWRAFGWSVREVDGHDHASLMATLHSAPLSSGSPSVIIARTTKGKGVDFMENQLLWHYKSPNADELDRALAQLPLETGA